MPKRDILNTSDLELTPDEVAALLVYRGEVEQGTEAWFEERLGKVTASRVKDVISGTKYKRDQYMFELVTERLTSKAKRFSSRYTDWGNNTEEVAAGVYAEQTGREVRETGFHEHEALASGASPDRLIEDDGLLQVKCPNSDTHLKYIDADRIPAEYYDQMMWELAITGRQWNDFMSYDPAFEEAGCDVFIKRLERDDEYIEYMTEKVAKFLQQVNAMEQKIRLYAYQREQGSEV